VLGPTFRRRSGALIGRVSCVSCVSWMYCVTSDETYETVHWESGMRYQPRRHRPDLSLNRAFRLPRRRPGKPVSEPLRLGLRVARRRPGRGIASGAGPSLALQDPESSAARAVRKLRPDTWVVLSLSTLFGDDPDRHASDERGRHGVTGPRAPI